MPAGSDREAELARIRTRIHRLGLSDYDAWMNFIQCGGNSDYLEFEAYLHGALTLSDHGWVALRQSVWEAETF